MFSNSSSPQLSVARPDSNVLELQSLYQERKDTIQKRLLEFKQVMRWNDEEVFAELAFCLLTPQSSARVCWDAVSKLKQLTLLLKGKPTDLFAADGRLQLKSRIESFYNPFELRQWLVENVMGLGYKEASHFLRNIGLGEEFAILDRHILRNLARLKVIPEVPASITKKRYLEIEEKLRRFAADIS